MLPRPPAPLRPCLIAAARVAGLALLGAAFLFAVSVAFAADPPATNDLAHVGNYCISCHSANDSRLVAPLAWDGHETRQVYSPCPTVRQLRQEISYADDALDAISNGITAHGESDSALGTRLLARKESLPRLLETDYRSREVSTNAIRLFRFQLNKDYAQVQTARQADTMQIMLVVGIIVTLFLLGSFAWGLKNTRHLPVGWFHGVRPGIGALLFVLLVFTIFALPIFNPPATDADTATAQDMERQSAIDTATRAAVGAENTSAKAWQLARLASVPSDTRGLSSTAALSATRDLQANASAYWGRARSLEEAAVIWDKARDAAPPIVQRLEIASGRVWTYAAMADELATTNPSLAKDLLEIALARTPRESEPYFRDLDLKKIAVGWLPLNRNQAIAVANQIRDPFIRAWALRELDQFTAAAASARQTNDISQRALALREIATASKDTSLLDEALVLAQSLPDPARAYALSDLAAAWFPFDAVQAARVANSIAAAYPDARASALRRVSLFAQAWSETDKFAAGSEKSRAQAELVGAWARVSPDEALAAAQKIHDAFWNAEAQRGVVAALARTDAARAHALVEAIRIPFVRVQALSDISNFREAAALADSLHDPYPLRDLAIRWCATDPTAALALVDKLDREVDRAEVLLAVAMALAPSNPVQANALFDRAVRQAQAARVTGDPLYSVELLRELGEHYAPVDKAKANEAFRAALDAAQRVTTNF